MNYPQAVTEDGEPVAVTENYDPQDGYTVAPSAGWPTRPCSWALILKGDHVTHGKRRGTLIGWDVYTDQPTVKWTAVDGGWYASSVDPADLTLVCGEPSELRKQNPAWRWD